jgi:manganese/zinc/iron transport system substrate-binding protein
MQHPRSFRRALLTTLLFAAAAVAVGCADPNATGSAGNNGDTKAATQTFQGEPPFLVVTTTGMVADTVRVVAGDHLQVLEAGDLKIEGKGKQIRLVQLMGERVDPHLYKASPGDLSLLDKADVIFYSGLHLEGKLVDVFERMSQRKPTIAVTASLEADSNSKLLEVEKGYHDPHIWFDVQLWRQTVTAVADELARFDPNHAKSYQAIADDFRTELDKLHTYCKQQIESIPKQQRVLVTAHDAFHYMGRAYGLEVKAIQGVSTDSEASAKHIEELVEFIVKRKIKAVFIESSVSDHNIKLLIEGCAARDHTLTIGGELYSDAPGKPGTEEGTYIGMVRHNVDTIVKSLK